MALTKADIGRGLVAGLCVACIAIIADRLLTAGDRTPAPPPGPRRMTRRRARAPPALAASGADPVDPEPLGGGHHQRQLRGRATTAAATSCASATTSPSTASCAVNELAASRAAHAAGVSPAVRPRRARRARPRPSSTAAPSRPRTSRAPNLRADRRACPPRPSRDPEASARARRSSSGSSTSSATTRTRSQEGAHRLSTRAAGLARHAPSGWSGPSGRSSWSSATTTCSPPTSSTTAAGSGWSTGTMPASTARCSIWAASPRTASCRRREREWLLEAYFERPVDGRAAPPAAAMLTASLLREAMWSMVSELHSRIDFDFRAYTAENLARFERALAAFDAMDR